MESVPRRHVASAAAIWLLGSLLYAPTAPVRFTADYDAKKFPARAAEKIRDSNMAGRVFSTDAWSGYLIYRLPGIKVYIDGRSDFYGPKFGEEYSDVLNVKHGWEDTLSKYGVETILLPPESYLSAALKESHEWRCVYDDGTAIVFQSATRGKQVSASLYGAGRPVI